MVVCTAPSAAQTCDEGPPSPLRLEAVVTDDTVDLTACGELEFTTAWVLRTLVRRTVDDRAVAAVVVDAADIDFIDSSGLSALIDCRLYCDERAIVFRLRRPSACVRDRLTRTGLAELLLR